jgi:hypothetical protein
MVPSPVDRWAQDLANNNDEALRLEFYRIQQSLATIIYNDVCKRDGMFHGGNPNQSDVAIRLELQRDYRPFNTIGVHLPFPLRSSKE